MHIEETIKTEALPVNSKAMLSRLNELLDEHNTNDLTLCKTDARVQAVLWLLNSQVYSQCARIDMSDEWDFICTRLENELGI